MTYEEEVAKRLPPALLLSTTDVALALGISAATVREMLESGALDGLNLAGSDRTRPRWYVYRSSLLRFLTVRKSGF